MVDQAALVGEHLGWAVHSLVVPKAIGNATILNYRRGSSTSTLVRVVLS